MIRVIRIPFADSLKLLSKGKINILNNIFGLLITITRISERFVCCQFHSLHKVFENFIGDFEQSLNCSNGTPLCETMKNNANSGEITIENALNGSGVLAKIEISDQCSTQAKRKFVEILEDVRIQPSADSRIVLKQFINSSFDINSNQTIAELHGRNIIFDFERESFAANNQYFGDHVGEISSSNEINVYLQNDRDQSPERFQEIIEKVKNRASPVLEKANDQCEICRKKLARECFLIHHRRVHLAEYPIHCIKCFEIFFKFTEKDCHEVNCQKIRYECYRCRKTLLCYAALKQHMQRH